MTVVMSFFHEIRNHKLQAVRALLTGWLVKTVCLFAYARKYAFPDRRIFFDGADVPLFVSLAAVAAMMFSGWLIACTNRPRARVMVFLYVVLVSPLSRVIAASFFHYQMVNVIAVSQWISLGIAVAGLSIGGGVCINHRRGNQHATTPA